MKTNTLKTLVIATFAHLIALSVILAHSHAGDIAKHSITDGTSAIAARSSTDINAKVVGDLHNHIDKTTLKNVMKTTSGDAATLTRRRESRSSLFEDQLSLFDRWIAQRLFWQTVFSLRAY